MHFKNMYGCQINWDKPVITLDVNQIALREPSCWPAGLPQLEFNYFKTELLELCITPTTSGELTNWKDIGELGAGSRAYERFQKSQLFKNRPEYARAGLNPSEADAVWTDIRSILWPTDKSLNKNQIHDVSQLYFHTVASGCIANSSFVTLDNNFLTRKDTIKKHLGVTVMSPGEAWQYYQPKFSLQEPSEQECGLIWASQKEYLQQLRQEASI